MATALVIRIQQKLLKADLLIVHNRIRSSWRAGPLWIEHLHHPQSLDLAKLPKYWISFSSKPKTRAAMSSQSGYRTNVKTICNRNQTTLVVYRGSDTCCFPPLSVRYTSRSPFNWICMWTGLTNLTRLRSLETSRVPTRGTMEQATSNLLTRGEHAKIMDSLSMIHCKVGITYMMRSKTARERFLWHRVWHWNLQLAGCFKAIELHFQWAWECASASNTVTFVAGAELFHQQQAKYFLVSNWKLLFSFKDS